MFYLICLVFLVLFFPPLPTYVFPHNPLFPPFFFPLTHLSFLYLSQLLSSPTLPPHTSPLFLHSSPFTFTYAIPSLPYFHHHHSPSCLPSIVAHRRRRCLLPVPWVGLEPVFLFTPLSHSTPRHMPCYRHSYPLPSPSLKALSFIGHPLFAQRGGLLLCCGMEVGLVFGDGFA